MLLDTPTTSAYRGPAARNAHCTAAPGVSDLARGLRVPLVWTSCVGWDSDTFAFPGGDDMFYAARLASGDALPGRMT